MTLLQRDREKIELGREEGSMSAIKVLKLHNKGIDNEGISNGYGPISEIHRKDHGKI